MPPGAAETVARGGRGGQEALRGFGLGLVAQASPVTPALGRLSQGLKFEDNMGHVV